MYVNGEDVIPTSVPGAHIASHGLLSLLCGHEKTGPSIPSLPSRPSNWECSHSLRIEAAYIKN